MPWRRPRSTIAARPAPSSRSCARRRRSRRDAADDEQALALDDRPEIAGEDALDRGAEIDRRAEERGALGLLEDAERGARGGVAVPDPLGEGAAGEALQDAEIGAVADAEAEDPHRPRELGEARAEVDERRLADGGRA